LSAALLALLQLVTSNIKNIQNRLLPQRFFPFEQLIDGVPIDAKTGGDVPDCPPTFAHKQILPSRRTKSTYQQDEVVAIIFSLFN
jgi:hypothetical protein